MPEKASISQRIKEYAFCIGFDACGICKAEKTYTGEKKLKSWLEKNYHADMYYLANNFEKRTDPRLLVENAKSIICVALNYYPSQRQPPENPQIAYYAYGQDYHKVVKNKLSLLFGFIQMLLPEVTGRYFCDTAPVLERYWASEAGIGFVGKNTMLIIPRRGSFYFLGEIITDIELEYDKPLSNNCGTCRKCMEACPTKAIEQPYILNSNKCISYHTIENKGEIPSGIIPDMNNCLYGCDICQKICPWNKFAKPHGIQEFIPSEEFIYLNAKKILSLTPEKYNQIFKESAVKRVKYTGIKRNMAALEKAKTARK